jgi:hypothetical protein
MRNVQLTKADKLLIKAALNNSPAKGFESIRNGLAVVDVLKLDDVEGSINDIIKCASETADEYKMENAVYEFAKKIFADFIAGGNLSHAAGKAIINCHDHLEAAETVDV